MKFSKNITRTLILSLFLILASCSTRLVSPNKPMQDNSIDLYKKYTIQTKDAKTQKVEIVKIDATKIYGKNKAGEMVEIEKSEVREIRKPDILASAVIALAAIAAVVFIPI
ncbi:bacteriophage spanin2 family protein [Epilithonimonas sp. JDS]|uniref:bacteriophage spanin2 family protein n=1 Tax=Epilithonimonas sp. JDS TaxID=2902797 RepID=UPI001E325FA4|nr:bacteriophage spanin2 family protein [Epilithonimonas sp. JDS]MCD9854279.1 bacteriophage spanin2 family protein [Epilithonimonas sp. JDS]